MLDDLCKEKITEVLTNSVIRGIISTREFPQESYYLYEDVFGNIHHEGKIIKVADEIKFQGSRDLPRVVKFAIYGHDGINPYCLHSAQYQIRKLYKFLTEQQDLLYNEDQKLSGENSEYSYDF